MSKEYNEYLNQHIGAVTTGYNWIIGNVGVEAIRDILPDLGKLADFSRQIKKHDMSKWMVEEYNAYDDYFYGDNGIKKKQNGEDVDPNVQAAFDYAWLRHIHANPHHWQHWVLVNDDKDEGSRALEMPDNYILEMILDWWTFSWRKGDLYEIFNWWNEHSDYILLGEKTREKVLGILRLILDRVNEVGGEVEVFKSGENGDET